MSAGLLQLVLATAILLLVSVLSSRAAGRVGVPALLLFLIIGMLAGSDGPGGIAFDYPGFAQALGVVALAFILFGGGLGTHWDEVRPVAMPAIALATVGVAITAGLTGWLSSWILGIPLLQGLLLGAIVSSTDAAAVFAVLRSRSVRLPVRLRSLLELESGSNDPIAVFLTVGLIAVVQNGQGLPVTLALTFVRQMVLGAIGGYVFGRLGTGVVNRARLEYDGLYPVLTFAWVLLVYGATQAVDGSGFLAVYIAGIVMRRYNFIHKRSLIRFHDALAWLMQIVMFLTLGLQVFPTRLPGVAGAGLAISAILMFVARPLGVFAVLPFWRFSLREQSFVAWVGLRGAAPIILATFPLVAHLPVAERFFSLVFFIVLTSTLVQGTSIPFAARLLHLSQSAPPERLDPLDLVATGDRELLDVIVSAGSPVAGRRVLELTLPPGVLLVLVERGGDTFVPSGGTIIQPDDRLIVLTPTDVSAAVKRQLEIA
ncbi:MAG TPA: potassium/proton antiporter [Vicinamibacterales bacterium]|nr:potassium/proton antiporter [Vicinamibacterales bacterium]